MDMVNEGLFTGFHPARPASGAGSHPTLELAHRELPDHEHAGLAIVEARYGGKILAAIALEDRARSRRRSPQAFRDNRRKSPE